MAIAIPWRDVKIGDVVTGTGRECYANRTLPQPVIARSSPAREGVKKPECKEFQTPIRQR